MIKISLGLDVAMQWDIMDQFPFFLVVRCSSLIASPNTTKYGHGCNESAPGYNTNCFFHCNRGFEAEKGSERVTCKETGLWDGDPLQCNGRNRKVVRKYSKICEWNGMSFYISALM